MSLSSQVSSLATRLGQEVKALWIAINAKVSKIASSTDNAIARFDSTAGAIQNSAVTIDDNGKIATVAAASGYAPIKITPGTAPSAPVDGDLWTATAGMYYRNGSVTQHVPRVSVSGTAPASPVDGDLWIDNTTPAWTNATIHSPWSQYSTFTLGYMKDAMGFVNIRGCVTASGSQTGTANYIFLLPAGYRPGIEQTWICMAYPGFCRVIVYTDGTVWVFSYGEAGTSAHVDLSAIRFWAA